MDPPSPPRTGSAWQTPEAPPGMPYRAAMADRVPYDEFAYFHENAEEFGLPYDGPPVVRRESGRRSSRAAR